MQKIRVKSLLGSPYLVSEEPNDVIGGGAYAKVVRAYNSAEPTEKLVAKIISCKDAERAITIKAEVETLKRVQYHVNLVNCKKIQLSSENNFYLIMEYCGGGTLEKVVSRKQNTLTEGEIREFLAQFCEGYKILIEAGVIHRDIKPQNIMIHNSVYKIADFGFARTFEIVSMDNNMSTKGTPLYMAPELLLEGEGSNKVDVFSLGIILFRMAYKGAFPFYDPKKRYGNKQEYIKRMMATPLTFPTRPTRSSELKQLISSMLEKDKGKRISWEQIFLHPFLKEEEREVTFTSGMVSTLLFNKHLEITNKSVLNVNLEHNTIKEINQECVNTILEERLIMQPVINNTSTELRRKLYSIKRVYTLIEHISRRLLLFLDSHPTPSHIKKKILHCVSSGLQYALYIIKQLETLSGSWSEVEQQIRSLENIFNQDRQILERLLQKVTSKARYMVKEYELSIYELLTQYSSYPLEVRRGMMCQVRLMIDVYDDLNGMKDTQDRMLEEHVKEIEGMPEEEMEEILSKELKTRGLLLF